MNRIVKNTALSIAALLISFTNMVAQEINIKDYRLYYKFSTLKQSDNSRKLTVSFIARNKKNRKDRLPIYQGEIEFKNYNDDSTVVLGTVLTNKEGIAELIVPANHQYLTDGEGYLNLEGLFNKTASLPKKRSKIRVKDIDLTMNLSEIDSVRTVVVNAFVKDSLGTSSPVEELNLKIAVGSMFSRMPLHETTLYNGEHEFEFPSDIPGSFDGNLTVFTILEDHDDYGDVIKEANAQWGMAKTDTEENNHMLWSSAAPYWMYIVLTIMLVGVWANYVYTIYNLFILKKEGELLEYN